MNSAAFGDESHICICFASLFILLKPEMNFVAFGEGLLLIQFPDAALQKGISQTQFFNVKCLFFVDTDCRPQLRYCDGSAKPLIVLTRIGFLLLCRYLS